MSESLVIGVVGLAGSGKSTVVTLLEEHFRIPSIYFGGLVLAELSSRGLEPNAESEQLVREDLRDQHGMAAIAHLALPVIKQQMAQQAVVLLDGIYSWAEVAFIEQELSTSVELIAVSSNRILREERMATRAVRPHSQTELWQRDLAEVENLQKATPIALANWQLGNNGSQAQLQDAVAQVVTGLRLNN